MSLMDMWATCDRCSFKYRRRQLRVEATGFLVCRRCDDKRFDLKSHPQNRSAPPRRELREVPDGRPDVENPTLTWDTWCIPFGRELRQTFFLRSVLPCVVTKRWDSYAVTYDSIDVPWDELE